MDSTVLAIIPAKGTSSRVPLKNTRVLGGQPLVRWTVQSALAVEAPKLDVWVSTDEGPAGDEVERLVREPGVTVIRRPAELCRDPAEAPDVALHALEAYRQREGEPAAVVMLLPTSPFRSATHIEEALALFAQHRTHRNVVSGSDGAKVLDHKLCYVESGWIHNGPGVRESSPLNGGAFLLNGAIWISTPGRLRRYGHFRAVNAAPYYMDEESGLDIDTELDLAVAETIVARRYSLASGIEVGTLRCVP